MNTEQLWNMITKAEEEGHEVDYYEHPEVPDILVEAFDGFNWYENTELDIELDASYDSTDEKEYKAYYYN